MSRDTVTRIAPYKKGREPANIDEQWQLIEAIQQDDVSKLEKLLSQDDIDVDTKLGGYNWPLVSYAARCNSIRCVKKVVELGANITAMDVDGKTPLMIAADRNRTDVINYFVRQCNLDYSNLDQKYQQIIKEALRKTAPPETGQSTTVSVPKTNTASKAPPETGQSTTVSVPKTNTASKANTLGSQVEKLTLAERRNNQEMQSRQLHELGRQFQLLQQSVVQLQGGLAAEQQKSHALESRCESLESALALEQERSKDLKTKYEDIQSTLVAEQQKSQALQQRCNSQEERLKAVEDTVERLWAISRDEVILSNKILGTEGWGYVTEAIFRGRRVAAKCLHEAIVSPHNLEQFAKEMKISARCRHRNLVEFVGAVPDHPAIIVIEMMDCTLRFALSNRRATPNHIHSICFDVAQGLDYLHSMQPVPLIHRDVSAPNVLLKAVDGGWLAKLSDLGSAQFANVAQTLAPGNVLYAAPEVQQRETAHRQTVKIDVFSYGILIIEILSRQMPTGTLSVLINSLQQAWPQFTRLIQCCTATDPALRPTMKQVIAMLNTITV